MWVAGECDLAPGGGLAFAFAALLRSGGAGMPAGEQAVEIGDRGGVMGAGAFQSHGDDVAWLEFDHDAAAVVSEWESGAALE